MMIVAIDKKYLIHNTLQPQRPSFGTKLVSKDVCNFDTFTKLSANVFGDKPIEVELLKICQNPKNLIGQGNSKRVYSIPGIENYVLAVLKKIFNPMAQPAPFHSVKNPFEKFNFGQPIAENSNGLTIAGKVEGTEHSLPAWINEHKILLKDKIISESKAEFVLNQLRNIASFPLKAYEDLAAKFKYLNERSARVDPINPNNMLIDDNAIELNIIDLAQNVSQLSRPYNGVRDMEVLLLDSLMHKAYKDALTDKKAETLADVAKIIIEKCKAAAGNVNLKNDSTNTLRHFDVRQNLILNKSNKNTFFVENYQEFLNLYKDIL